MNFANSSGALVSGSIQNQDAWGNVLASTTTGAWASTFSGRHLTTKEYDADAGLFSFNGRWYDPMTASFLSPEPIALSIHYRFCLGNPVSFYDSDGLFPIYEDPTTHVKTDLNWPECSLANLIEHATSCPYGPCSPLASLRALGSNLQRIWDCIAGRVKSLTPRSLDEAKRRGGGRRDPSTGKPYFNPENEVTGGDFCANACVCLHEYVHVLETATGFKGSVTQREFPAYLMEAMCNAVTLGAMSASGVFP